MEEGNTSKHHLSLVSWSRDSLVSSKCHLPLASLSGARSVSMAVGETGVSLPCTLRDPRQPFLSDEAVRNHVETRVSFSGGAQVETRKGGIHKTKWGPLYTTIHSGHLSPHGSEYSSVLPSPHPSLQLPLCSAHSEVPMSFFLSFFFPM